MEKTAVITGGASGIGGHTARVLKEKGWKIWCLDVTVPDASGQAPTIGVPGVNYIECDVTDRTSVQKAIDEIRRSTATIDALICCAGILRTGKLEDHTPEQVDLMMNVNIKGPWLVARELLPLLRNGAGPDNPSRVVFVGSISGIRPKVGAGFYGATKAALHVLTGVLAVELAQSNILVNAVAPGTVNTPMVSARSGSNADTAFQPSGDSPLGRIACPNDITNVILFFLGVGANYVTGTVLPVDGGTRAAFYRENLTTGDNKWNS